MTASLGSAWPEGRVERVAAPLREQVIDSLRGAILDFRLRLVERELIETLGVSRTTVREALRELDSEGLVTVIPQRGAFVAAPSPEEASDIYEARIAIENTVIAMFVERATSAERKRLAEAAETFAKADAETTEPRAMLALWDDFAAALHEGAHSPVVTGLSATLGARVQVLRVQAMKAHKLSAQAVRAVVKAINAGDTLAAQQRFEAHLRRSKENALKQLSESSTA